MIDAEPSCPECHSPYPYTGYERGEIICGDCGLVIEDKLSPEQGNSDFTESNGVVGGSGIPSDPYVIEGIKVAHGNYFGPGSGIRISNTDAYFVLRGN
jgi:hypothetical protein